MNLLAKFTLPIVAMLFISGSNSGFKATDITTKLTVTNYSEPVTPPKQLLSPLGFTFENFSTDKLPDGWQQFFTGPGGTEWKILKTEKGNQVLAQTFSDNPNGHFNGIVYERLEAKNLSVTVRLKAISGQHDQGGGLIWRYLDQNNYYVVRANPLEDNVVLYKVEKGKRTDLPLIGKGKTYGTEVPPLGSGWNTLKLIAKEDTFKVYLNGMALFSVADSTFMGSGKTGLWTKADAVTYFDDLKIELNNL